MLDVRGQKGTSAVTDRSSVTLLDVLETFKSDDPDRTAYLFLSHDERVIAKLSYTELHRQASAIGNLLQTQCIPRDRVLILCPPQA